MYYLNYNKLKKEMYIILTHFHLVSIKITITNYNYIHIKKKNEHDKKQQHY